jgi:peptide/nickel transport system ATP-binding protein
MIDVRPDPDERPDAFLVVQDLRVHFPTTDGVVKAVDGLSFTVDRGQILGIVGESGSGKSVTSQAILGLHKGSRAHLTGEIWLNGVELNSASEARVRSMRGDEMAMIFQDPLSSLHPFFTVGEQISEAYRVHNKVSKSVARKRTVEMLDRVGIPNPDRRSRDYPHQSSGGMRQRAMIAMALVNNPRLLIADEPTTALDVTVQAQILDLIQEMQKEFGSAVIMITHDLGVIAEVADEVLVMYAGRCVEKGTTKQILTHPEMPYTWGLLGSIADVVGDVDKPLVPIPGTPPSLLSPPSGCSFHPRCVHRDKVEGNRCVEELPELRAGGSPNHLLRCHLTDPDAVYETEVKEEVL